MKGEFKTHKKYLSTTMQLRVDEVQCKCTEVMKVDGVNKELNEFKNKTEANMSTLMKK